VRSPEKFVSYPMLVLPFSNAQKWNFNLDWSIRFEFRAPFHSSSFLDLGSKNKAALFDKKYPGTYLDIFL